MKNTAYLLQAALIASWWLGMLLYDDFYAAFQFPGIGSVAFNALLLPDLVMVLLLSLVRAYRAIPGLEYVILGGFGYAALYCVNAAYLTEGGYLPTTIMLLGLAFNLFLVYNNLTFRTSTSNSLWGNALKTAVQIICVWSITLVVFPLLLMESFNELTTPRTLQLWAGGILFVISSLLGLASAVVMVSSGRGTPLPLDQTQRLVVSGPYAYVRNPMAVAGIGQGLAVSLAFGSISVLVYALLGGILWNYVVRPLEEQNMLDRFGEQYWEYQQRVRCWWPG
jgi:protein-S-isoprenylcysteine O-methyltransferase Ste14